ncbi:MAG: C39 family peptidase [Lachnospiraceae bacterium]|nr:C39 family peptidase [Lachnospiraceae bacterium]
MNHNLVKQFYRNIRSTIYKSTLFIIVCINAVILIGVSCLLSDTRDYTDERLISSMEELKQYITDVISEQTIVKETVIELKPDVVYERSVAEPVAFTTIQLNVEPILQYPELPTGCEVTALATVLNFYGLDVDKVYLANEFLPMGGVGEVGPMDAFIGNPQSPHSYGCYAPVIKTTAEKYLTSLIWLKEDMTVEDITGTPLNELDQYIVDGVPVIIWASMDMAETRRNEGWNINGETVYFMYNEHCLVLIGFTETEYIFADPLNGIKSYEKGLVNQRYGELGQQAVIIY